MSKIINNPEELERLRNEIKEEADLRKGPKDIQITVHMGTCGIAAGARDILSKLADELHESGVDNVTLRQSCCAGLCDQEPLLTLTNKNGQQFLYGKLDGKKVRAIVREHVLGGHPVTDYIIVS